MATTLIDAPRFVATRSDDRLDPGVRDLPAHPVGQDVGGVVEALLLLVRDDRLVALADDAVDDDPDEEQDGDDRDAEQQAQPPRQRPAGRPAHAGSSDATSR